MSKFRPLLTSIALAAATMATAATAGAQAPAQDPCAAFKGKRYLTQAEITSSSGSYIAAGVVDFNTKMVHSFWTHKTANTKAEGGSYTFSCAAAKDKSGMPVVALTTSSHGQVLVYPTRDGRSVAKMVNGNGLFANVPARIFEMK